MVISMLIVAYIAVGMYLYKKDRHLLNNAMKYIEESLPIPKSIIAVAIIILIFLLPLHGIKIKVKLLCEKWTNSHNKENDLDEDISYFINEYYPELIANMDETAITMETEEVGELLATISGVFDMDLAEHEIVKIERMVNNLNDDDEENVILTVEFEGDKTKLVIKARYDDDERLELRLFSENGRLIKALDKKIDGFIQAESA